MKQENITQDVIVHSYLVTYILLQMKMEMVHHIYNQIHSIGEYMECECGTPLDKEFEYITSTPEILFFDIVNY